MIEIPTWFALVALVLFLIEGFTCGVAFREWIKSQQELVQVKESLSNLVKSTLDSSVINVEDIHNEK